MKSKAIIWINWGTSQQPLLRRSTASAAQYVDADLFVISDNDLHLHESVQVIHYSYLEEGYARKAEALARVVPKGYQTYLFLDADTVVLEDISLGFDKAKEFDIAIAIAPTYLLDEYHRTSEVLELEELDSRGQLLFNTGVIFFSNRTLNSGLFGKWLELTQAHHSTMRGDQEMLTIAMELLMINPYVLSKSYNTRGRFETIIGTTRIWHQRSPVPEQINGFDKAYPPRILARGRLTNLRLKDTYGGTLRFLRLNVYKLKTKTGRAHVAREIFRRRKIY
jgi:hypothetical protein